LIRPTEFEEIKMQKFHKKKAPKNFNPQPRISLLVRNYPANKQAILQLLLLTSSFSHKHSQPPWNFSMELNREIDACNTQNKDPSEV
jgi:hypothetical protein